MTTGRINQVTTVTETHHTDNCVNMIPTTLHPYNRWRYSTKIVRLVYQTEPVGPCVNNISPTAVAPSDVISDRQLTPIGSIVTVLDPMSRKRNQVGWATKRHSVTRAQSQHAYLQETFTTSNLRRKLQVIGNINPKGVARLKHACKSVIISLGIAHQYKHLSGLATACGRRSSGALGWSKSE